MSKMLQNTLNIQLLLFIALQIRFTYNFASILVARYSRYPCHHTAQSYQSLILNSGYSLCGVSHILTVSMWISLASSHLPKQAGRWIGYSKLTIGVNECVIGCLHGILQRTDSMFLEQSLEPMLSQVKFFVSPYLFILKMFRAVNEPFEGYDWCLRRVLLLAFLRFVFSENPLAISNSFFLVAVEVMFPLH